MLYGAQYVTYNFHVATHLSECSEIFGTLDKFSAFIFEKLFAKVKGVCKN